MAAAPPIIGKWIGDPQILIAGSTVAILAIDPNDPSPAKACWIRHWEVSDYFPRYRSCDLCDIEIDDKDYNRLETLHVYGKK